MKCLKAASRHKSDAAYDGGCPGPKLVLSYRRAEVDNRRQRRSNVNSLNTRARTTPPRPPWQRHVRSIIAIHPSLKASPTCRTEPAGCSRTRAPTPISGAVSANRAARGSFPIKESHHNRTRNGPSRSFSPRIPRATTFHRTPLLPRNGLASLFHLHAPRRVIRCYQTRCITSLVPRPRTVQLLCAP